MGKIVKLKNANNVYTYPITKTEAVYIEDNKTTLKDYLDATAIIKTVGPAQMVTFNDGADNIPVKSCIINLEPYQEGSGDPYPAGGGENLFPYLNARTTTAKGVDLVCDGAGKITITGTATASDYISLLFPLPFTVPDGNIYKFCMMNTQANSESMFRFVNGSTIVDSWAPSTVNRETAYSSMSLKEVTGIRIYIVSGTTYNMTMQPMLVPKTLTVSEYIPYSNIRPISGRTGLTVTRTGKNLLENTAASATRGGVTLTVADDGTITANGTATNGFDFVIWDSGDTTKGFKGEFVLNGCLGGTASTYRLVARVRNVDANTNRYVVSGNGDATVVTSINEVINRVVLSVNSGSELSNIKVRPMLRPSTITDDTYEPYTGTEIPVTWETEAGTVYGGTLDAVSGKLTVKYSTITFDGTQTVTDKINSNDRVYMQVPGMAAKAMLDDPLVTCNRLPKTAAYLNASRACVCIGHSSTGNYIYLQGLSHIDGVTNLATFNAWLADNPVVCTYELAEPQIYQLTPIKIKTLLNYNTIYTNIGNLIVNYVVDMKTYIDNKITELQTSISN